MRVWTYLAVLVVTGSVLVGCATPKVTTRSLLREMTDLGGLAEYPDPPFTCKQFSSYDRRSKLPEDHEAWFANADAGHFLRVEERGGGKEYVMMDAVGPGAIVRIWSANPRGTLRIYLNHAKKPVIEAPMADVLGGKLEGIPVPIAGQRSRGWNSYFPIPYSKHCKITSDEGGFYYHVNYRTYPPGTKVAGFKPRDLRLRASEIDETARLLASPQKAGVEPAGILSELANVIQKQRGPEAGTLILAGSSSVWRVSTPGAIVGLRVKVNDEDLETTLRQLVLRMSFDGEETVVCPLGDFFGAAPGINPYGSLTLGVSADGTMWCHWVMPFQRSARLEIHNTGDTLRRVDYRVAGTDYVWTERSMHFHAKWRAEYDVPTRPMRDWNYLTASGRGVFVGAAFAITNPVKNWWGEGDEKIYVDGESFPSHFGTGTEDYFGYAWCWPETFTHAYHNQPRCDGPGNYGHTAVNRWHVLDRIPFEHDFRFDMELWHWNAKAKVAMSVVSYWYARPGGDDGFPEIDPADLRVVEIPEYVSPRVAGALEGEEMRVVYKTGTVLPQNGDGLSNEQHQWWREGRPGDYLVLGFQVENVGQYRVFARFLKARDYGIVRLSINGEEFGEPIDLYSNQITPSKEVDLGIFNLQEGLNTLKVEIVGANEQAVESYMFGLDYLRLGSVSPSGEGS